MSIATKDWVLLPELIEAIYIAERTIYKHKKSGVFKAGEHFYRVGEGTVKGKCVYSIEKCRKAILEHTKKTKKKGETYKKKMVKDLVNKELGNGR